MPTPKPQHQALSTILTLSTVLLGGCRDAPPTSPDLSATGPSRVYQYCDPYAQECPCDPNAIIGGCSSDPVDTHVSADIAVSTTASVTTSEPFSDPVTGTETTAFMETAPDVHLHADAGYTYAGAVTVQTQFTDGADPTHTATPQTVAADLTADNLTEVNSASQQLADTPPPDLAADSPMGLVGSTQNGDVTAGVLVDQVDTVPVSANRALPAGGPLVSRAGDGQPSLGRAIALAEHGGAQRALFNGVPVTVAVSAPGHLVVTDDDSGAGGATTTLRTEKSAIAGGGAARASGRHVRTFALLDADDDGNSLDHHGKATKGRKQWILAEDRSEADEDNGIRKLHQTHVLTYRHVKWFRNRTRDAARHAARSTADWIPLANAGSGSAAPLRNPSGAHGPSVSAAALPARLRAPSAGPSRMMMCDDECQVGYRPAPPSAYGVDPGCGREIMAEVNPASSQPAINLLFQHGIWSDATTWCDMSAYLRGRFVVGNEVRHSLSNVASYEDQSAELVGRFQQDQNLGYAGSYMLIGHSNGGVVSRYTAQSLGGIYGNVRGVVTVSSPHAGANLAHIAKGTLVGLLAVPLLAQGGCQFVSTLLCTRAGALTAESGLGLFLAISPLFTANNPVLHEMTPGSSFHQQINERGDPNYVGVAVVNEAWDKWTEWRLIGDHKYCTGDYSPNCGDQGHRFVNTVDKTYHRDIKCAIVSGFLGFVLPGGHAVALACAREAAGLKVLDMVYKRVSVGRDHGDGIVASGSQRYPNSPVPPYVVPDADSHLGVTHAQERTGTRIAQAIHDTYGAPYAR